MTISVVICAYDEKRWPDLKQAVSSVFSQTTQPSETIVVIDHNPALLAMAERELEGVTILDNHGDRGAAASRNVGAEHAHGEVLAFLDDDAFADPDWTEQIARAHTEQPILGIAGRLEPQWESGRPRWFPEEFQWVVGCSYRGLPERVAPVRNVISANMSVDRELFIEAGGFRKGFGKVGTRSEPEDTELCIRLGALHPARPWLYWPAAKAGHRVPPSRASFAYFVRRCRLEGIGKASLQGHVDGPDGLTSEREYVVKVLPSGVAANLAAAVVRRDLGRLLQAGALLIGLAVTVLGFVEQLSRLRLKPALVALGVRPGR